jgi:hypothetical protein
MNPTCQAMNNEDGTWTAQITPLCVGDDPAAAGGVCAIVSHGR